MSDRAVWLSRWAQSQARLAMWRNAIARDAGVRLAARLRVSGEDWDPERLAKLYDEWIDCAEAAYAAAVQTEPYCTAQADLINATSALLATRANPGGPVPGDVSAGCSLRDLVWKRDKVSLYRYRPLPFVPAARARPLLICFALVNRPYVLDLQPDRSLVQRLLAAGLEVYLVDWGYPDEGDHGLALSDYIEAYLGGCITHVLQEQGTLKLNLLGICQGGTLSLCYCALHSAQIENLVLLATPVDFHTPDNLLARWARPLDMELITRAGNLPGALLTGVFLALRPFRLMHQKYVAFLARPRNAQAAELFARMELWIFDSPDLAGTAGRQFVQWLYQENRLVRGALQLGSRRVSLQKIRQPILNVYGTLDHIVPPSTATAIARYVGSRDYTEYAVDTGHIGLYISRPAGQSVSHRIASWLRERA